MKYIIFIFLYTLSIFGHAQSTEVDKSKIPQPVFDANPSLVDLYWTTWQLAWEHVKHQPGLIQSPYMDEAFWDDTIWIWDTEFMVLFCKYAPDVFPGIESLNNFYEPILNHRPSPLKIQHPDNPPFYAWVESEYYQFTNDQQHIEKLINEDQYLQRYFDWFDALKPGTQLHFDHAYIALEKKNIGYKWGGVQSGMDNTPRGKNQNNDLLWIDAIAQQALAALNISRMASEVSSDQVASDFLKRYNRLKKIINDNYWDAEDGFYYDIRESDRSFVKVKTPASFWVLLAEVADEQQAKSMMMHAQDTHVFGGEYPWPTVARNDLSFNGLYGDYWRGAIWLPTAYMATKSLEKYGHYNVTDKNAANILELMLKTYQQYEPATIWECYNPNKPEPSHRVWGNDLEEVRSDFCGWSALGPISLFIENVLGFHHVNAKNKTVEWRKYQKGRHGIKRLKFGDVTTDIIGDGSIVEVTSNTSYTLIINGERFQISEGTQEIRVKEVITQLENSTKVSPLLKYPSPFTDFIDVSLPNDRKLGVLKWILSDLSGKPVLEGSVQMKTQGVLRIENLGTVPTGTYFINITGSGWTYSDKVIKK